MNASTIPLPNPALNTKPLWAAVGVLGVAVVALGASLIYVQNRPVDGHAALAAISTPASVEVALPLRPGWHPPENRWHRAKTWWHRPPGQPLRQPVRPWQNR
jgi:hypothetical protein